MHKLTQRKKLEFGYAIRQLPMSAGLVPDVKYFTIYQLGYKLVLSETRLVKLVKILNLNFSEK